MRVLFAATSYVTVCFTAAYGGGAFEPARLHRGSAQVWQYRTTDFVAAFGAMRRSHIQHVTRMASTFDQPAPDCRFLYTLQAVGDGGSCEGSYQRTEGPAPGWQGDLNSVESGS